MSKNSYPYPPDEFDSVDPNSRPKEVHAARRSTWSKVWPFVVVVVAVPVIAFGVMKFLSAWDNPASTATGAATGTSTPTASVTDSPASPSDDGVQAGSILPSGGSSAAETSEAPPPIDRTVPVAVLNAKGEQGLAGRARDLLGQDGWTSVEAGDYRGDEIEGGSAVYYGKNAWSSSAESVAGILGIDIVEKDRDGSADGITVVLRQDFTL